MPNETIHAGEYQTTEFDLVDSLDIESALTKDGWRLTFPPTTAETADALFMEGPEGDQLVLTTPQQVYDPSNPSARKKAPPPKNADEWVTWLQAHPNLDTYEPEPVGESHFGWYRTYSGGSIDVTATSTPDDYTPSNCGKQPCIPLFPTGGGIDSEVGTINRFITVTSDDRSFEVPTVVIDVAALPEGTGNAGHSLVELGILQWSSINLRRWLWYIFHGKGTNKGKLIALNDDQIEPLGRIANRVRQAFHEDSRDFYPLGVRERPVKSLFLRPQLLAYQRQRIRERRRCFVVPSRSADGGQALLCHSSVGEEGDQREQAQQSRSGAPDSLLRALPLRFEPQALTHLLKGGFHLPAPYKPRDDPLGIGAEIGAKERLSSELSLRITDQDPAHRHGRQARGVPKRAVLETTSTEYAPQRHTNGPLPMGHYQDLHCVLGSWATTERFGNRSPLSRGLPI
jgi:hypothetical protein